MIARRVVLVGQRLDQFVEQVGRNGLLLERVEARREVAVAFAPGVVTNLPRVVFLCEVAGALLEERVHRIGDVEEPVWVPPHRLLRRRDLLLSERLAVCLLGVVLRWCAVANVRPRADEARLRMAGLMGDRAVDGGANLRVIVPVIEELDEPAVGLEAFARVLRVREGRVSLDSDVVVVVNEDQVVELKVPGHARRLVTHALHEIAVAREAEDARPGIGLAEARLLELEPNRHSDGVADALAERPGRRFDTGGEAVLRVTRRLAPPLPKVLDLRER